MAHAESARRRTVTRAAEVMNRKPRGTERFLDDEARIPEICHPQQHPVPIGARVQQPLGILDVNFWVPPAGMKLAEVRQQASPIVPFRVGTSLLDLRRRAGPPKWGPPFQPRKARPPFGGHAPGDGRQKWQRQKDLEVVPCRHGSPTAFLAQAALSSPIGHFGGP